MIGRVSQLDAALQAKLEQRDLIVFDGECVLCSGFFRFMLRRDRSRRFAFATAQSPLGQSLYQALGLPTDDFETNLVVTEGGIHGHLDAFAAAMGASGWPWRLLGGVKFLPRAIKMPLYRLIARNRFRIFGRYDQCMIPDAPLRARFAPDGF
ncbi:thiol-disulfide oxidoreductase [Sulfitobacter porphyrae]|nr:thiol-disulfide oxidoreductase [Sulfitobacter porphyrae]